ncbi:MAG: hypothetical protein AAF196_04740 [Planctomycetota bacterium]
MNERTAPRSVSLLAPILSLSLVGAAIAQPARVERHAFRQLEDLRTAVSVSLGELDLSEADGVERRERALRILGGSESAGAGVFGRAWSVLRGGDGDDLAALRSSCVLLALPEVADRDRFETIHLTAHLSVPFDLDGPIDVRFLRIDGDDISEVGVLEGRRLAELRSYKLSLEIPIDAIENGESCEFGLQLTVGGEAPRDTDWTARSRVFRFDGFADAATQTPAQLDLEPERRDRWAELIGSREGALSDPWFRGRFLSACEGVHRVWHAESGDPLRDPVLDLRRALRWDAQRRGEDSPTVEASDPDEVVRLIVPYDVEHEGDRPTTTQLGELTYEFVSGEPTAVVLFVPGVPTRGLGLDRPMAVRRTSAGQWHDRLRQQGFGPSGGDSFDLCVLESVGRLERPGLFLESALELARSRNKPIVVIGEREGGRVAMRYLASALADEGRIERDDVRGIVLAGGGVPSVPQIESFTGDAGTTRSVLLLAGSNDRSRPLYDALRERTDKAGFVLSDDVPWSLILDQSLERVRAFIDEVAPGRSTAR